MSAHYHAANVLPYGHPDREAAAATWRLAIASVVLLVLEFPAAIWPITREMRWQFNPGLDELRTETLWAIVMLGFAPAVAAVICGAMAVLRTRRLPPRLVAGIGV